MKRILRYLSKNKVGYFFILPGTTIVISLLLYPIVQSIVMSFTYWYLLFPKPGHPFVGLANYKYVLSMSQFQKVIITTALYAIVGVVGKMYLGLGTALLLNRQFSGRSIVRAIAIIPWAMPAFVVSVIFRAALDPVIGIINLILIRLHIVNKSIDFLTQPNLALMSVILIAIWKAFPFIALMLLAALKGISKEVYEAASIDGAGIWTKFTYITRPLLRPVWSVVLVLQIVWTIKEFNLVYLVTRGGPDFATQIMGIDIYNNAFEFFRLGAASAEGVFLITFSIIFTIIYIRLIGKKGNI